MLIKTYNNVRKHVQYSVSAGKIVIYNIMHNMRTHKSDGSSLRLPIPLSALDIFSQVVGPGVLQTFRLVLKSLKNHA